MAYMTGPTPHLEGEPGCYAETVLVPGDPRRATFVAETYLDDAVEVNAVRGMTGYTGTFEGMPVSVQSVGMGVPSAAIYYTELARFYGVRRIVRIGSCGGLSESVELGSVIVATAAGTDSGVIETLSSGIRTPPVADPALLQASLAVAGEQGVDLHVGTVFTSDLFYDPREDRLAKIQATGAVGVEMETAGLYALGVTEGYAALSLLTVSDDIVRGTAMSSADRENTFDAMMRVALGAVARV